MAQLLQVVQNISLRLGSGGVKQKMYTCWETTSSLRLFSLSLKMFVVKEITQMNKLLLVSKARPVLTQADLKANNDNGKELIEFS